MSRPILATLCFLLGITLGQNLGVAIASEYAALGAGLLSAALALRTGARLSGADTFAFVASLFVLELVFLVLSLHILGRIDVVSLLGR